MISNAAHHDQLLREIAANTRRPISWGAAILIALVINLVVIPFITNNNIQYISGYLQKALQYEEELAIDLGVIIADTRQGINRVPVKYKDSNIIGLNRAQAKAYMHNVRLTESGHNYQSINQYFYLGAFQFGASALAQVGLIKPHALKRAPKRVTNGLAQKTFLKNNNNWTINGGYQTFLNDPALQDAAFIKLTNFNISQGFRKRVLKHDTSAYKIAGFAKAAHLKGTKAAIRFYKYGKDSADGNGTRVSIYAKQAETAVKNVTKEG